MEAVLTRSLLGGLLLAGCGFHPNAASSDSNGGGSGGGGSDAGLSFPSDSADAPAECTTWNPHHFDACAIPAPSTGLDLDGAWTFSTDTGVLTSSSMTITPAGGPLVQASGPNAYIISIQSLKIETTGSLRVIGQTPLVVASWGDIDVIGSIDAGSTSGGSAGAGANPTLCTTSAPTQGGIGVSTGGSGGGGGGAFHGNGGNGGIGDMPQGPLGGVGGVAVSAPAIVRGGCSGAPSGEAGSDPSASDSTAVATGGIGGGAVQLSSRTSITISGHVLAGGGGGGGAPDNSACGGGGGGAGGFLGFDASKISFTNATIAANGGGGGGSQMFGTGLVGTPGQDGQPSGTQAAGGAASSCSEAGMLGGAGATTSGASSTNPVEACGGAGGGGGVGFVLTWGTVAQSGSTVSPIAQSGP
jgi:hypothetical protein